MRSISSIILIVAGSLVCIIGLIGFMKKTEPEPKPEPEPEKPTNAG